ncbi:transposase family protein [Nonomuraea sp. NPDC051941]|uniref:transposase family protein n=1 Tax=Nonomuraea sp. NPDC051941 TaxID=3364373 RepID=UPI0037C5E0D9
MPSAPARRPGPRRGRAARPPARGGGPGARGATGPDRRARAHVLGALYAAAAGGLPILADGGYDGAGIGVHTPIKQPAGNQTLSPDSRTYNQLLRSLRCLGERGFALLKGRWRILQHITAGPSTIGDIARAALVLTHFEHNWLPEIR